MPSAKEFWAIDFDRCIGNVDALYGVFERLISEATDAVDVADLEEARAQVELAGGSFDVLAYVKQYIHDDAQYQALLQAYTQATEEVRSAFINPGTLELFAYLESRSLPYGIVSYGHEEWQRLKIAAAGLADLPCLILDHPQKGAVIASWQTSDGFIVPEKLTTTQGLTCERIVLVDDKAVSFSGLPDGARGYWVRLADLIPSQMGTVPVSVTAVTSLFEVVTTEKERLH